MRKLLLSTTALIAAGAISSAAVADVSISGSYKFSYQDYDSGITTAGESGDRMYSEQNIVMSFSNKTDSGLNITMLAVLNAEGDGNSDATTLWEDHNLSISGGFGKLQLGSDDGAGDQLTRTAHDISASPDALHGDIENFHNTAGTGNLKDDNADLRDDIDDEANITYILPKMGGLTLGASFRDAGNMAGENNDETSFAAKYDFDAGEVKGSIHYGQHESDGATAVATSLDGNTMAIDLTMGAIRAVYATSETDVDATVTTEITDFGVQYKMANGMVVSAIQTEVKENTGGETLDVTSVAASYTIASGLNASLTYHDYDYAVGTSNETADDGSATIVSITASF
ncbi:porin [Alphaproteobacteria bacterium]|nr:porin [Alphaproteobacteria bacterium]